MSPATTDTAIPATMRGWHLTGHGGFEVLDWREDIPVPHPGPGEVLIRVAAAAINNTDINTRTAWYSKAVRGPTEEGGVGGFAGADNADGAWDGGGIAFPRIQGADCCGRVVAVGAGVDKGRVGERVVVRALQSTGPRRAGRPNPYATWTFGSECDGGFAEYAVTFTEDALPVNADWTDGELASVPCASSTAEGMIQRIGLHEGSPKRVLVTGASGGVGSAAVQLLKARGHTVVAQVGGAKARALRELGADETLPRDGAPEADSVHAVLDLVAGPGWPALIDALRRGGRYVASGAIAGPIVELDVRTLYLRDLTLAGSTFQPNNILPDVIALIEAGRIRPVIAETYPLPKMIEAQEAFLAKRHVGKIVLEVGGTG